MTALNVKYNNDKSRDFTNPSLPPGDPGAEVIASAGGLVNASDLLLIAARQRPTITGERIGGIYLWFHLFIIFSQILNSFCVSIKEKFTNFLYTIVNGLGAPSVLPPFALGLGTPLTATGAYGSAIPSLGAFALTTTAGIGQSNPASLRGFSNVLLVSNLNEEVRQIQKWNN